MSDFKGGRCGRCGAYIYGEAVEFNGWWLHPECVPHDDSRVEVFEEVPDEC